MIVQKKTVEINVFIDGGIETNIEGRLLGLLSPAEFAGIIDKPELRSKLFTVQSKDLSDIVKADGLSTGIVGQRLAMAVTSYDDNQMPKPTLFITEPLDLISSVVSDNNINVNGGNNTFFIISQEEV